MKNDFLESPVTWNEALYAECREIVRKAIVSKTSGLEENPNRWQYYFHNYDKVPSGYGTGTLLLTPRKDMT